MRDSDTRIVWLTLLAMRNKDGEIFSSMVGLSHTARVGLNETKQAIDEFLSPDPDSTTKEHEGRRLVEIQGGWRLLNHEKIKAEASAANKTNYMQGYMKEKREHIKIAKSMPQKGELETELADAADIADDDKITPQQRIDRVKAKIAREVAIEEEVREKFNPEWRDIQAARRSA